SLRRLLKSMHREGETGGAGKQDLEINPHHALIARLERMRQTEAALAAKVAEQLLDNALVSAGLLEDPRAMVKRMNELLEQVLAPPTAGKAP
ncbi:MAG: molecular chaperone HtpG, partial [Verrucomicrobia bacterium]|nr:molecular chaperone HtpG [Verrucomicrobiota bacterium]